MRCLAVGTTSLVERTSDTYSNLLDRTEQAGTTRKMTQCPLCSGAEIVDTVRRDRVPAMQNSVHRTRESALSAPQGELTLAACRACGFAWNRTFDPSRVVYDDTYDNAVPSTVAREYYGEVAEHVAGHGLEDGLVVDIGGGDGAFLTALCDAVPGCRGLGIDPALDRDREELDGRIVLVKDVFAAGAIDERPSLVVCRHVLEHIPGPVEFLRTIRESLDRFDPCPCFFEVPDLGWIVENETFWDFCYEHCNYFTQESLSAALRSAGFEPAATRTAFGSQYRWMEALPAGSPAGARPPERGDAAVDRLLAYASTEVDRVASVRRDLVEWKAAGSTVAVWGMSTKGILFSSLVDRDASLIDLCIDVNPNKQGCFAPLTGEPISAPDALRGAGDNLLVVVMNDNYRDEIAEACRRMGLRPTLVNSQLVGRPARAAVASGGIA